MLLDGADIYDWHTANNRTELISLQAGRLTIVGGDYRASNTTAIPQVVNGSGTNGLVVLNAQKSLATNWQGGSIVSSLLLDTSASPPQFQITGTTLWLTNYPTLAAMIPLVPSPAVGMVAYCGDCQPQRTTCSPSSPADCVCAGGFHGSGMFIRYENFMGLAANWYCH